MSGEMKVNRWRLPLLVGVGVVLAVVIAIGIGTLLAHDQKAGRAPAAFASSAASSPTPADRGAEVACGLNNLAIQTGSLEDPDSVGAIVAASKESAVDSIRIQATLLSEQLKIALAARGQKDAAKYADKLRDAAEDLRTTCISAGYL
jgi:hypothetical protein